MHHNVLFHSDVSRCISFPLKADALLSGSSVCLGCSLKQDWLWHLQDRMDQMKSVVFKMPIALNISQEVRLSGSEYDRKRICHCKICFYRPFEEECSHMKWTVFSIFWISFFFFKGRNSICVEARVKQSKKKNISGESLIPPGSKLGSNASKTHFQCIPELYIYMLHSALPGWEQNTD